jgi:threonine/homoserine/homoserine lactone efflux protein
MIEQALIGGSFAFAAAVQPGPLQAYFFSRVTAIGWKRTLPAAASPLLSDGPIAVVALLLVGQLSQTMQAGLRLGGGLLLLFLTWRALREWRFGTPETPDAASEAPRTLFEAAFVNLLNPNPYLGWTLILGPVVVSAWRESAVVAVVVVVAFYATLVAVNGMLIVAFGSTRFLGPSTRRSLLLVSALILAGLAAYQLALASSVLVPV